MNAATIASRLNGRKAGTGYSVLCPAHPDKNRSLSVGDTADGRVLVHCQAGCEQSDVIEALKREGLWTENGNGHRTPSSAKASTKPPISAAFVRAKLQGEGWVLHSEGYFGDLHRQVRFHHVTKIQDGKAKPEKTFRWEHRVGNEWFSGTGETAPPIYLNRTAKQSGGSLAFLLLLEGWAKADACDALGVACASFKEITVENAQILADFKIIVWPDNDKAGRKLAAHAIELVAKYNRNVFLIEPPAGLPVGGDIIDLIGAGWDRDRIFALIDSAGPVRPLDTQGDERAVPVADVPSIFSFGSQQILWAVDQLVAMSAVTMIAADSGTLKSTLATAAARAVADGTDFAGIPTTQREVLILDRGENTLPGVQERYGRMGIRDGDGLRHYGDWLGDVPSPASLLVLDYVRATDPKPLIVVDSLISFLEADENDAVIVRKFMRQLRQLATLGAGVIIQHHAGKDSSKKYRGSSDIKASVDVAYELDGIGDPTKLDGVVMVAFKARFSVRQRLNLRFDGHKFWSDGPERPCKTVTEQLRDLLIANPGIKSGAFERLAGDHKLGRDRARAFLINGRRQETIEISEGPNNALLHTWVGAK